MKNDENGREPDAPSPEGGDDRSTASTEVIDVAELQTALERCRADDGGPAEEPGELDLLRVPVMAMAPRDIRWHQLDHRAGLLLSRVDGRRTYAALIESSGMKHTDAVRLLLDVRAAGIITDRAEGGE